MKNPPSQGLCQLCNAEFTKTAMTTHLKRCLVKHEPPNGKAENLFHLVVEGFTPYWLHVEMPGNATLADLDRFLRELWLECCGHMSAFDFNELKMDQLGLGDNTYSGDNEFPEDELMDYELTEILEPKLAFGYEYDFGSTTKLRIKVAGIRAGKWNGKQKVRLLARNLAPALTCTVCGKPAILIDSEMQETLYCADCAKNEDVEMFLPVVNSPRMGVCGYTGPEQ